MAKFSGVIGFVKDVEESPGVWISDAIIERKYYGDIIRNNRRFQSSDKLNDNLTLSNKIKVLADDYMRRNMSNARYVVINSIKWKVTDIEYSYPSLIITIGEVYNG